MWWPAFLQIKSNDPEARLQAVQRLADSDSARSFEMLTEATRDEDGRVSRAAVKAIGKLNSEKAVSVAAVEALSHFGGTKATDALVPMLRHADHRVRVAAIDAVAGLEGAQATEALTELLKDSIWDVRRAAAHALGKCKDAKA